MSDIVVVVTKSGKLALRNLANYGYAYTINKFVAGDGGHDPATGEPLVPDRTLTSLPQQSFGPKEIGDGNIKQVSNFDTEYSLEILSSETNISAISNVGLIGTLTNGPNAGGEFLYGLGNFNLFSIPVSGFLKIKVIVKH